MPEAFENYIPPAGRALVLRPDDVTAFRSLLAPVPSPTADLHLAICWVDAFPTILTSSDAPETGLTTAEVGPLCIRCQQARAGNTALFNHVVRMINASRWLWSSLAPATSAP